MAIRVLQLLGGMDLGGGETFVMHVYRAMNRDQIQFDFAVSADKKCYYDDEIRSLGGRIIRHTPPAEAGFRRCSMELKSILQQYGPYAAVHSHLQYFSGFVLRVAALENIPVRLSHFHNTRDARSGSLLGLFYHVGMGWLIKRYATRILGCGRNVLDASFGAHWTSDPRMSAISNGIELEPYSAPYPDRAELRRRLGIPFAGQLLGHIGRFDFCKNHRFLIEILRSTLTIEPNANLVLVGDGALRPETQRQVEELGLGGHVHFLGKRPQSDIPSLLAAFDVFVMPSIHEGLPVTLVEAQAAGVPCVVSDEITKEADFHLGLMRFLSLKQRPEEWAKEIALAVTTQRPEWLARRDALRAAGYDIQYSANVLASMYRGAPAVARRTSDSAAPEQIARQSIFDIWK